MSESQQSPRPFGLYSAVALVVANMIGAGVFTTSGLALAGLPSRQAILLAWALGGLVALCGAISYGQLARRITESGGEYLFLSRLLHPAVGFLAGWVSLLAGFTGAIAFAAKAFESYALPLSIRPEWYLSGTLSIASIVLFGLLHSLVLRTGVVVQNVVVVFKLALLTAFLLFAFSVFPDSWEGMRVEAEPVDFPILALASALVWISLSFAGFNAAVYVTGEVANPKKNVPRALILGTILVGVFYLALNFVFLFGADPESIRGKNDVAAIAAQSIGGPSLATLIRLIVSIALLSSVSSMVIAGPRVYAKMASDGVFPSFLRSVGRDSMEVPIAAVWLQVSLASVVVCFSTLSSLLDYLGFTLSVSSAITVACIFWTPNISGRRRGSETSARRWIISAIAFAYVAVTIGLAILSAIHRPQQLIGFAITVVSGIVLYSAYRTVGGRRPA